MPVPCLLKRTVQALLLIFFFLILLLKLVGESCNRTNWLSTPACFEWFSTPFPLLELLQAISETFSFPLSVSLSLTLLPSYPFLPLSHVLSLSLFLSRPLLFFIAEFSSHFHSFLYVSQFSFISPVPLWYLSHSLTHSFPLSFFVPFPSFALTLSIHHCSETL